MKNNGFTLIELLAVITILSIILLIVFASVTTIMKNSKNSLHKSQIKEIEKAAEYYNNEEGLSDHNICVSVEELIEKGYIKEDKILDPKTGNEMTGSVKIKFNGKKYSYEYREKGCQICKVKEGVVSTELGTKYSCEVKDDEYFNFYVLKVEGDKVNLIMDRNICEDGTVATETNKCLVAWYANEANNNYGPATAMTYLYNSTKGWSNVPNMELAYTDENNSGTDYGYTGITTSNGVTTIIGKNGATNTAIGTTSQPLKARLPKYNEVYGTDGNHCTESDGSCPSWLVEFLADTSNPSTDSLYPNNEFISGIQGYWLLSSYPGDSAGARHVYYGGSVNYNITTYNLYGVRPVIAVLTSDLS